jgi:unconventional prefoldin RPB5 interactor 1
MAAAKKGTATPLGAVFSPDDTRRAVSRVAQAVADRRAELARVQGFFADNAALVSLVQRLPDELSHQIMVPTHPYFSLSPCFSSMVTCLEPIWGCVGLVLQVPFGGAAFFPGSLIHTNQLMVWHSAVFLF